MQILPQQTVMVKLSYTKICGKVSTALQSITCISVLIRNGIVLHNFSWQGTDTLTLNISQKVV